MPRRIEWTALLAALQPKSWEGLDTFRTQAQRGVGGVCMPEPEG